MLLTKLVIHYTITGVGGKGRHEELQQIQVMKVDHVQKGQSNESGCFQITRSGLLFILIKYIH